MRTTVRARTAAFLVCAAIALAAAPATAQPSPRAPSAPATPGTRPAPPPPPPQLPTVWHTIPSAAKAAHDAPITYTDGCHAAGYVTVPKPCTFGNPHGARTILLFGDSHAAHWHAAVIASAAAHGWRVLTLTKSSCPAASVYVRRYKQPSTYAECSTWRTAALAKLRAHAWGRIDVVVVSNWHFHQVLSSVQGHVLTGTARAAAWQAGMRRTLASLLVAAPQVVLLRDSPQMPFLADAAKACYARYGTRASRACGTTKARALNPATWRAELAAAANYPGRVAAYDLTSATCSPTWCGPVIRPYLMFKDDNHWNQTFMKVHFAPLLRPLVEAAMARANP
jgi:hypothetical protein